MTEKSFANQNDKSVEFLYGTKIGKAILEFILFVRIPKLLGFLLRTPLSKFYIKKFVAKNGIDMSYFEGRKFSSFNDFFTRKIDSEKLNVEKESSRLISPSDSLLSVYKIEENSTFHIKGFDYTLEDFFGTKDYGQNFVGGDCLVFRLCATDYHRYCYIDNGKHEGEEGKNHFLRGKLYSVQPKACENFRVYTKNRRSWTILSTENFGKVAQIEVGAFSVGGIVNHLGKTGETESFKKGDEKGFFDLHGSTIVLLFEKNKIRLNEDVINGTANGQEFRVKYGSFIGTKY